MKILDYARVTALKAGDVFLTDGVDGTKTIIASQLMKALIPHLGQEEFFNMLDAYVTPEQRRMTFRGKNLGGAVTGEQKAAIQNGSFKGLFLGDYWVIGGVNWRITDIDYWFNCGDAAFTRHHLVIMPENALYNARMNADHTTVGGYLGSEMYTTNLETAKTTINSAFPGLVLTHRDLFVNAVTNGRPSGGGWFDSSVDLPTEIMMYGTNVYAPSNDGTNVPYNYTINKQQLALFAVCPRFIVNRSYNQWLRDVVSAADFALVTGHGGADCDGAAGSYGVRPAFAIG